MGKPRVDAYIRKEKPLWKVCRGKDHVELVEILRERKMDARKIWIRKFQCHSCGDIVVREKP